MFEIRVRSTVRVGSFRDSSSGSITTSTALFHVNDCQIKSPRVKIIIASLVGQSGPMS